MAKDIGSMIETAEAIYAHGYEDGYVAALNQLEALAKTNYRTPVMVSSDKDYNEGIEVVLYDLDSMRWTMKHEGVKNYEV